MKNIFLVVSLLFISTTFYGQSSCISGNCQNGEGTYTFQNGDMYSGSFANGNYNGYGTYFYKNGTVSKGTWQNGKLIKKMVESQAEKNKKIVAGLTIPDEVETKKETIANKETELALAGKFASKQSGEQNFQKAAVIYQKYADLGDVQSMMDLGFLYQFGDNTLLQDYSKALQNFKLAAAQNNNIAQAQMGYYNEYGYGISVNNEEAMKWYRIAEANGNRSIRFNSSIYLANITPKHKTECPVCHGSGIYVRIIKGASGTYKNVITPSQQLFTSDALAQMRATGATAVYSKPVYSNYDTHYSEPDQQIKETCNRCHGSGEVDE